ncbi:MAG: hypothetical protein QNK23_11795 [Crocinitomicaceae bacterium]|nr:hypothetical protein [Crocinitomicaceae bacterium]
MKSVFLILSLLLITKSSLAQGEQPDCNCCTEEYDHFDFWIGEWEVFNLKGDVVGTNSITAIQGNCVLQENWTSASGGTGTSLNFYDNKNQTWNQLWIDNSGNKLDITGGLKGNQMIMLSEEKYNTQNDVHFIDRITWTPNENESVRQHWERTTDNGITWKTLFDGLYKRKS